MVKDVTCCVHHVHCVAELLRIDATRPILVLALEDSRQLSPTFSRSAEHLDEQLTERLHV